MLRAARQARPSSAAGALRRVLLALAVLIAGIGFWTVGGAAPAAAATSASCGYADPGSGTYARTLCWLDFGGYSASQATGANGQQFEVAVPGGYTLSFTLKVSGGPMASFAFPTWAGAYLGNAGNYSGVSGRPALYQTANGTTTTATLSNIVMRSPAGTVMTGYSLVGADAESTDVNESLRWASTNPIYSLTANGASNGLGNACSGGFTGVGTTQVTCTGAGTSAKTGTAILASNAPSTFAQQMVGGGRQAFAFGVLVSDVQIVKSVASRFPGDDFRVAVADAGTTIASADTGPAGTSADTGNHTVVANAGGTMFTFGETAISGDLGNYTTSWACTRNGAADPALPSGAGVGPSAGVMVRPGDAVRCTVTNTAKPAGITVQKRVDSIDDVNGDGLDDAGDVITFAFAVTNTGEIPLTSIAVDDPTVGPVDCPPGELAPGATTTCTASYTVTPADQTAGTIDNTATASATPSGTATTVTSSPSTTSTALTAADPQLVLTKSALPSGAAAFQAGQPIAYTFVARNSGNVTLTDVTITEGTFSGTGPIPALSCPAERTLAPGQSLACTATYTLTLDDVNATEVTNTAEATGTPPNGAPVDSPPASVTIPVVPDPSIGLTKSVDPSTVPGPGSTVTYSFLVVNTGNVTLTNVTIDEDAFTGTGQLSNIECPAASLAPGASTTCTASYVVTSDDADAGVIHNTATATATPVPPTGTTPESDPSSATVVIPAAPAIAVAKSADPSTVSAVGTAVTYTFAVTNTGNVTLNGLTIDDGPFTGTGQLGDVECPTTTLAAGGSTTCTATYTVTQADLDLGRITNIAAATGTPVGGGDPVTSPPAPADVTVDRQPSLSFTKSASPEMVGAGQQVTYSFLVTNIGNVSVSNPSIDEIGFSGSGELSLIWCPIVVLAPGDSATCTAAYTVTQADADTRQLTNRATATADPPFGAEPPASGPSDAGLTVADPELSLQKTASADSLTAPGQRITYTFRITNTGNVAVHDVGVTETSFSGTGTPPAISCPASAAALDPGRSVECTAEYTVTQADIDAGSITITATAHAIPPGPAGTPPIGSPPSAAAVAVRRAPGLSLVKSVDRQRLVAGQTLTFSFLVTNTGNVTLRQVTVDELEFTGTGTLSAPRCPADAAALAPGARITCTATYTVTNADVSAGSLRNTAVVRGTSPATPGSPSLVTVVLSSRSSVELSGPTALLLPRTGADVYELAVLGAGLLLAGSGLLVLCRRRAGAT